MMDIQITCKECGSSVDINPTLDASKAQCEVCQHVTPVKFTPAHLQGRLEECPVWTYGISLVVLYLLDVFLFRKLSMVAICYKCQTNFRHLTNMNEIRDFDHEMNDRIVYSDHDFKGKPLSH